VEDLARLKAAGLTRLHIGMETGDDFLLRYMRKGVTKEQHITAGRRVKESGIELSEYVIAGLGGKRWQRQHALETADALSAIDPDFIRIRTLKVVRGMPLFQKVESGDFIIERDEEILEELRLFIDSLHDTGAAIKSDHILNLLEEVDGKLPEDKERILSVIDRYFELGEEQRLVYRMGRRAGLYRGTGDLADKETYARVKTAMQQMEAEAPGSVEEHLSLLLEEYI
jgi:radical SAM superfamily enzyme YgiQ (UPF0313 family)